MHYIHSTTAAATAAVGYTMALNIQSHFSAPFLSVCASHLLFSFSSSSSSSSRPLLVEKRQRNPRSRDHWCQPNVLIIVKKITEVAR